MSEDIEFRLTNTELKVLMALRKLRKDCDATEVAEFLGTNRTSVSKSLNNLWRFKLVRKYRKGRIRMFTVIGVGIRGRS